MCKCGKREAGGSRADNTRFARYPRPQRPSRFEAVAPRQVSAVPPSLSPLTPTRPSPQSGGAELCPPPPLHIAERTEGGG